MSPSTNVAAAALLRLFAELLVDGRGGFVAACVQLAVTDEVLELAWSASEKSRYYRTGPRARALLAAADVLEREAAHVVAL